MGHPKGSAWCLDSMILVVVLQNGLEIGEILLETKKVMIL